MQAQQSSSSSKFDKWMKRVQDSQKPARKDRTQTTDQQENSTENAVNGTNHVKQELLHTNSEKNAALKPNAIEKQVQNQLGNVDRQQTKEPSLQANSVGTNTNPPIQSSPGQILEDMQINAPSSSNTANGASQISASTPILDQTSPDRLQRWLRRVQTAEKPPPSLLAPQPVGPVAAEAPSLPSTSDAASVRTPDSAQTFPAAEDLKDTAIDDVDLHTAISEISANRPPPPPATSPDGSGWQKITFDSGEYEGEAKEGAPNGFGRMIWKTGVGYHGSFVDQRFHGKGTFFFDNGDRCRGGERARRCRRAGGPPPLAGLGYPARPAAPTATHHHPPPII